LLQWIRLSRVKPAQLFLFRDREKELEQ
jgi:hypothetical protein